MAVLKWLKQMLRSAYKQYLTKFWLDYPITPEAIATYPVCALPLPLSIPECRQMWKVKYHPLGYRLLFNSHYTIMDTHLTFFLSVYLSLESSAVEEPSQKSHLYSSCYLTWSCFSLSFFSPIFGYDMQHNERNIVLSNKRTGMWSSPNRGCGRWDLWPY